MERSRRVVVTDLTTGRVSEGEVVPRDRPHPVDSRGGRAHRAPVVHPVAVSVERRAQVVAGRAVRDALRGRGTVLGNLARALLREAARKVR